MSATNLVVCEQGSNCTFSIDDLCCGIEVCLDQEVNRQQSVTHVPLASRLVAGLMNLRGQTVTALNLRYCFGLLAREFADS